MKILHLSDSHNTNYDLNHIKNIDILIHTGDFSSGEQSFYNFLEYISNFKCLHKIIVAGNHDKFIYKNQSEIKFICNQYGIIYLQDEAITIQNIKFFGTPWTLPFGKSAFSKEEEELEEIFNNIPKDTNILLSHTPPYNILDLSNKNLKLGSISLFDKLKYLRELEFHLFGHIHEQNGILFENGVFYINSSLNTTPIAHIIDTNSKLISSITLK